MPRGNVGKRQPPEIGLFMECEEEELNPAQKDFYKKIKNDHDKFKKKLDDYLAQMKGELVVTEGDFVSFQVEHIVQTAPPIQTVSQGKRGRAPQQIIVKPTQGRGRPRKIAPDAHLVNPAPPLILLPEGRGNRGSRSGFLSTDSPVAPAKAKASEETAVGGIMIGYPEKAAIITYSDNVDSKECLFGKAKNYPSLALFVRPCLQPRISGNAQTERATLDVQVKGVLMFPNNKFTEWLIQQGLALSSQNCPIHTSTPLQLGMYTNAGNFPLTGGLVWLSECCPHVLVSVFSGSIFERSSQHPNVILKLMYHWACQTTVNNVVQWVKVDAMYIKFIYTLLRSVCVLAVNSKFGLLGGPHRDIQVGVIALGNMATSGKKFEVLGMMDAVNRLVRFRVMEQPMTNKNPRRRIKAIADYLKYYIDRRSTVVTDLADFESDQFGYKVRVADPKDLLDYMRKVIPRLFQNTLHYMSKSLVQQFLDELVWRERWGSMASHAFNNLVAHLAELTKATVKGGILARLKAAAEGPFTSFVPSILAVPFDESVAEVKAVLSTRKRPLEVEEEDSKTPKRRKAKKKHWLVQPLTNEITPEVLSFLSTNCTVSVDEYYYGTLSGSDSKAFAKISNQAIKCCICLRPFTDNLGLMRHLLLHYQPDTRLPAQLDKAKLCQQCFLGFASETVANTHVMNVHVLPEKQENKVCLICEKLFNSKEEMIFHMHRMHVAKEMPYSCQVCKFRSSSYSSLCEHILQSHKHERHMFCPYCLMSVSLYRGNEPLTGNVVFYLNHILRHLRQNETYECHRCRLSFVNSLLLTSHLEQDHPSFKDNTAVIPLTVTTGAMMPAPGNLIKPSLLPQIERPERKSHLYSFRSFPVTTVVDICEDLPCAECEGSMLGNNHYEGEMKCLKCKYTTCCEVGMLDHCAVYHGSQSSMTYKPGKAAVMAIYCACRFMSVSGNAFAKHLLECSKTTGYLKESAIPDPTRDTEAPNVLNTLGLMRKSPEPSPEPMQGGQEEGEIFQSVVPKQESSSASCHESDSGFGTQDKEASEEAASIETVSKENSTEATLTASDSYTEATLTASDSNTDDAPEAGEDAVDKKPPREELYAAADKAMENDEKSADVGEGSTEKEASEGDVVQGPKTSNEAVEDAENNEANSEKDVEAKTAAASNEDEAEKESGSGTAAVNEGRMENEDDAEKDGESGTAAVAEGGMETEDADQGPNEDDAEEDAVSGAAAVDERLENEGAVAQDQEESKDAPEGGDDSAKDVEAEAVAADELEEDESGAAEVEAMDVEEGDAATEDAEPMEVSEEETLAEPEALDESNAANEDETPSKDNQNDDDDADSKILDEVSPLTAFDGAAKLQEASGPEIAEDSGAATEDKQEGAAAAAGGDGNLLDELEDMMNDETEQTAEAGDFITDLINEPPTPKPDQ